MRVFVSGATGFIGSAIVQELLKAGHNVVGLARSDESAKTLSAAGAEVHRGSLEDLAGLKAAADSADGVIHTAFIHDFSKFGESIRVDREATVAMGEVLANSNRPFVITSGIAILKPGQVSTEDEPGSFSAEGESRLRAEHLTLAMASEGVRSSVVRLPPSVHGEGDHGFVPTLIGIARQKGVSAYIGDGNNRWPAVHRLDAAHLYRLALEKGSAGARYHGIAEEGIPTRIIAEAIGRHLGIPVVSVSPENAGAHFGWIGAFWGVDCPASSVKTQNELNWHPVHPTLGEDLNMGHYW